MKTLKSFLIVLIFIQGCAMTPLSIEKGDDCFLNKDYLGAIQAYENGLLEAKNSNTKNIVQQKIAATKVSIADKYLLKAEKIYNREPKITIPIINETLKVLENVSRWDDSEKRITNKINAFQREKEGLLSQIRADLQKASGEADKYHYNSAMGIIEQTLTIDPTNSDIQKTKNGTTDRRNLYEEIKNSLSFGDLDKAINAYVRLSNSATNPPPFSAFPLKKLFIPLILQRTAILEKQSKWFDAYRLLDQWKINTFNKRIQKIKSRGCTYYYQKAKSSIETQNDYYKGYIYSLKAKELDSKDLQIFQIHKEARDYVNKSLQKYIAIASFGSPSNEPDAGRQFSDSLISYLYGVLPYGINILERDKIDFVLREHKRETKSVGEILGVNLMITGTVSLFKVDRSQDKRTATIKFSIGKEIVDNPEFLQMIKMYGSDTSKWPQIPKKTIQKENYQLVNYSKGTANMKGFAKVSIRIFDTHKGTITFVKDFDASVVESCDFQDEVKEANISYIPMSLSTDTEVKEEMRKRIVTEIAAIVQASFENREIRFLNQADFYLDRREYQNAIEPLAQGYLYCTLDDIKPDNDSFVKIKKISYEMTE